ncbi:putative isopenicillin N synthetase [Pleomassaria siparia CBS 279.74]|uniref:Putative isopenicillin N synthetase n=1 Tax=Pleomassaria siparia CBS 279.74 TaxID=1314801 RepID=A0A6G1KE61_9PLEO|nr:putative isopenicillin N synthetase [Pleomassaria siparia CBS 279.74]
MTATTTQTVLEAPKPPLKLTLGNGQEIHFHSDTSIEADEIPIIDISGIYSDDIVDRRAVAEKIREAAHRIGFFYIVNHGIDQKHVENTFRQARRFFALPEEEKMRVSTDLVPEEFFGYFPMSTYNRNGKKKKDLMEAFNWGYNPKYDSQVDDDDEFGTPAARLLWPKDLPGFKETLYQHHSALLALARKMTKVFALALHLDEDYFDRYTAHPSAAMRITHYPQQDASPADQLGIGAHTDFDSFTFVTQDETAGLEVLSKSGYWVKATPIPDSMVVNIADCFMRQTNDFFVSTVHRVVNKTATERYSCPFFFGFDNSLPLEPVPTCVGESNPMKYPVVSSGEYMKWRAAQSKATSASVGKTGV